jgi:hypothetical protein
MVEWIAARSAARCHCKPCMRFAVAYANRLVSEPGRISRETREEAEWRLGRVVKILEAGLTVGPSEQAYVDGG